MIPLVLNQAVVKESDIYSRLLRRIIFLGEQVTSETANESSQLFLKQKTWKIFIVHKFLIGLRGLGIFDTMQHVNIHTVCVGLAASMGVFYWRQN